MSEVKVNKISPRSSTTVTLGDSGDTINIPSGVTLSNSGTATGFGINWQSSIKTSAFTAVAGEGYFINTTSAAITVTLPASPSLGDEIQFIDYAGTADTNIISLNPNGNKINSSTSAVRIEVERQATKIVYIDSTQGWVAASDANVTQNSIPSAYSATALVVAGGGGGGGGIGGGGGAGGLKTATFTFTPGTVYTATVGAGGTKSTGTVSGYGTLSIGSNGGNSSISGTGITTTTSTGGGLGGSYHSSSTSAGADGGSGGGAAALTGATLTGGSGYFWSR